MTVKSRIQNSSSVPLNTTLCQRRCLVTGVRAHKSDMLRFVVDPDGCLLPDVKGNLPGRGMWVTMDKMCIHSAVSKGVFSRGARSQVRVSKDLCSTVDKLFRKRIVGLLALARRSGFVALGFDKVKAMLKMRQTAIVLFTGCEISGVAERIAKMSKATDVFFFTGLKAKELSTVFDRDDVVFIAIKKCGISKILKGEMRRLSLFLGGEE